MNTLLSKLEACKYSSNSGPIQELLVSKHLCYHRCQIISYIYLSSRKTSV